MAVAIVQDCVLVACSGLPAATLACSDQTEYWVFFVKRMDSLFLLSGGLGLQSIAGYQASPTLEDTG